MKILILLKNGACNPSMNKRTIFTFQIKILYSPYGVYNPI